MGTAWTGSRSQRTSSRTAQCSANSSHSKQPPKETASSCLSWGNGATEVLKNWECHFAQKREAGAERSQQLWLTCPHSTAHCCQSSPDSSKSWHKPNFLSFDLNIAKMLWTQMNCLCKSNIVFLIFKRELQVPY